MVGNVISSPCFPYPDIDPTAVGAMAWLLHWRTGHYQHHANKTRLHKRPREGEEQGNGPEDDASTGIVETLYQDLAGYEEYYDFPEDCGPVASPALGAARPTPSPCHCDCSFSSVFMVGNVISSPCFPYPDMDPTAVGAMAWILQWRTEHYQHHTNMSRPHKRPREVEEQSDRPEDDALS